MKYKEVLKTILKTDSIVDRYLELKEMCKFLLKYLLFTTQAKSGAIYFFNPATMKLDVTSSVP